MASTDDPEQVEVELRSNDAFGASRSPSAAADLTSTSSDDHRARVVTRWRDVAVPFVVGVAALGIGWTIGRADGSVPTAAPDVTPGTEVLDPVGPIEPPSTATTTITTITPGTTGTPGTTSRSGSLAVPSDPAATPSTGSTTGDDVFETDVVVAEGLRDRPIEIVAYGNGRRLFRLDLSTSRLLGRDVAAQPFGRTRLLVGPTWALLPSNDAEQPSTIVWDDGRTATVDVGPSDQILGVADGGALWTLFAPTDPDLDVVVHRRTIQGEFTQVMAALPVVPSRIDPAGGVVIELPDGWFGVEPRPAATDATRGGSRMVEPVVVMLTSGRLLAISAEFTVVEECDEALACARYVVDRGTGERRAVESENPPTGPVSYAIAGTASVAPGGATAVVEVLEPDDRTSPQRSLGVVDLGTGEVTDIGPTQDVDQVAWTPDGRFLLYLAGGRLVAYDTASATVRVVTDELVAIDAFGVRVGGD